MNPGPPPKPTHLKLIQGNPGRRPLNVNEPKPNTLTKAPAPPELLGRSGKALWRKLVKPLMALNLLTALDLVALESYCDAYDVWMLTRREFKRNGSRLTVETMGGPKQNPLLVIIRNARDDMRKLSAEFGLSPASRSRVTGTTQSDDKSAKLFRWLTGKDL